MDCSLRKGGTRAPPRSPSRPLGPTAHGWRSGGGWWGMGVVNAAGERDGRSGRLRTQVQRRLGAPRAGAERLLKRTTDGDTVVPVAPPFAAARPRRRQGKRSTSVTTTSDTTSTTAGGPVDPTGTDAWKALDGIKQGFEPDLRGWFANEPGRAERYTFQAADLIVDLSKNLVTEEVL